MKPVRCGYCRGQDGNIYRVILTSQGKTKDSYGHLECVPKWSLVSEVEVRELVRKGYVDDLDFETKRYRERKKHPTWIQIKIRSDKHCSVCGDLISPSADKCKRHEAENREHRKKTSPKPHQTFIVRRKN